MMSLIDVFEVSPRKILFSAHIVYSLKGAYVSRWASNMSRTASMTSIECASPPLTWH